MILSSWPSNLPEKFYGLKNGFKDNAVVNEYMSGRVNGFVKNSRAIMTKTLYIRLTKSEQTIFWNWFNSIGGVLASWSCSAIGTAYYRFVSVPTQEDTDQKTNVFKLELEEVY